MTEREMFERSFLRPTNFFKLSPRRQWKIDYDLGILDWQGDGLSSEDKLLFDAHYDTEDKMSANTYLQDQK